MLHNKYHHCERAQNCELQLSNISGECQQEEYRQNICFLLAFIEGNDGRVKNDAKVVEYGWFIQFLFSFSGYNFGILGTIFKRYTKA